MAWEASSFTVNCNDGQRLIAGWVRDYMAIDFRAHVVDSLHPDGCWQITHIPTGFCVGTVFGALGEAQDIADSLMQEGDWSFVSNQPPKSVKQAFLRVKADSQGKLQSGVAGISPIKFTEVMAR